MIELRPYQEDSVTAIFDYFTTHHGNPLVVLPTGAGKSLVLGEFLRRACVLYPETRALVVSHVKELLAQDAAAILRLWPEAPVTLYSAGLNAKDLSGQVVVAGIQSIYRRAYEVQQCDLVLIDEAHLVTGQETGMYRRFLKDLRTINPHLKVVGLTATAFRTDTGLLHRGKDRLFTDVCHEVGLGYLIEEGYLAPLRCKRTDTTLSVQGVHIRGGDYVQSELAAAVDRAELNEAIVAELVDKAGSRGSWLLFCVNIEHANHIATLVKSYGISCATVFGDTPSAERARVIGDFKRGDIRCIVNVGVLTTGFDAPGVDLIGFLRPTKSKGLYVQMCLDGETEILARDGWRKAGEVGAGDEVAGFDLASEAVRWQPVLATVDRALAPGETMVGVQAPHLDFRVTDGHDMVLACRSSRIARSDTPRWRLEKASDAMRRRDQVSLPVAGLLDAPGLPLTDYEIAFLGWFLSDGTLSRANNAIAIAQQDGSPQHEHIVATLQGCGFRYGTTRTQRGNGYADLIRYRVSFGDARVPNGTGARGWNRLTAWIAPGKTITQAYDDISREQLIVLLDALNRGDGSKRRNLAWTPRTMAITCGLNRDMADRLQALCVTRGVRCNLTNTDPSNWMLRVCPDKRRAVIRGLRSDDANGNAKLIERATVHGERVWCVTTPMGTIVTRRNGKVVITGNCGRGTRLAEGKDECLVLDFAGNVFEHGPVDLVRGSVKGEQQGDGEETTAPVKECPKCHELCAAGCRRCPACGEEFPPPVLKLAKKAIQSAILARELKDEWLAVTGVQYFAHHKDGSPTSMRVEYRCGLVTHREWVCLEHSGYPRQKAVQWWGRRDPKAPAPATVDQALALSGELPVPAAIIVKPQGKYFEISQVRFA